MCLLNLQYNVFNPTKISIKFTNNFFSYNQHKNNPLRLRTKTFVNSTDLFHRQQCCDRLSFIYAQFKINVYISKKKKKSSPKVCTAECRT